jgi:peptidoglycan/LPS O-acetylase OafA/YrhL
MKRNPNLDLLRALLAFWVVMIHCLWFAGYGGELLSRLASSTVECFIVLSGYVITGLLLTRGPSYVGFVTSRFWRLFPAFAACLVIALLVRPWTLYSSVTELAREQAENAFFWPELLVHLTMLYGLVPSVILPQADIAFLVPSWSISLEFQLYLLAPLLILLLRRWRFRAVAWIAVAGLIPLFPPIAWRLSTYVSHMGAFAPQKLAFFLLGMAIYLCRRGKDRAVALVRLPGAAALVWIGMRSYSLYLIHYPILHLLRAAIPSATAPELALGLLVGCGLPLSILSAHLLYQGIEKPGIALGQKICQRIG